MTTTTRTVDRFGWFQIAVLECIYQHRLLSTAQLHALYPGRALRRTQRALAAIERIGWLASVRQPGGMKLWFVTATGADAIEAIPNRVELRRKVLLPEQAAGPLQQHTLGVNDVGIAFVQAARERPNDDFVPLAWRNEVAHRIGPPLGRGRRAQMLIADAVFSYVCWPPGEKISIHYRFVELDRTTMSTESLAAKLGRYDRLLDYQEPEWDEPLWRYDYPVFPSLMVVLSNASRRRLEDRRHLLLALWEDEYGTELEVLVCLLEDLTGRGPFAPIFRSNQAGDRSVNWMGNTEESIHTTPAVEPGT
jgi:Replication-relaxation